MRHFAIAVFALALAACQSTPTVATAANSSVVGFAGGDGSTLETAVLVNAPNEMAGVSAEHQWLRDNLPGAKLESQALVSGDEGRFYDLFETTLSSGQKRKVYFDITSYFGKY